MNTTNLLGLIDDLINRIAACPDPPAQNSLLNKLNAARDYLQILDCPRAETRLESFINEVEALSHHPHGAWEDCIYQNENEFISRAEHIIDTCENPRSAWSSIGQRKIPIIERASNWTGSSTNITIGTTNLSFNNIRQLVIANKDFISLGELGHLLKVGYNTNYSYTLDASYATSTNYVDNAKMNLFGGTFTTISDYFTILDPKTILLTMMQTALLILPILALKPAT